MKKLIIAVLLLLGTITVFNISPANDVVNGIRSELVAYHQGFMNGHIKPHQYSSLIDRLETLAVAAHAANADDLCSQANEFIRQVMVEAACVFTTNENASGNQLFSSSPTSSSLLDECWAVSESERSSSPLPAYELEVDYPVQQSTNDDYFILDDDETV